MTTSTPWYAHPLLWVGVGVVGVGGYVLYRRKRNSLGALNDEDFPSGGSILPAGLLARKGRKAAPKRLRDTRFEPPEFEPPSEPVPETEPEPEPPPPEKREVVRKVLPSKPALPKAAVKLPLPKGKRRVLAEEEKKLVDRMFELANAFTRGKGKAEDADIFCPKHETMCEGLCYRIGYHTGFCVDDRCVCSGWHGPPEETGRRTGRGGGT